MRKQPFLASLKKYRSDATFLVQVQLLIDTTFFGGVCVDQFHGAEANVICRAEGQGFAVNYHKVRVNEPTWTVSYPVVRIGHCFGNESRLEDCVAFAHPEGVPCSNKSAVVAVTCGAVLPDLEPDVQALQDSAYSTVIPLFQAQCALEENCFPPSVYNLISRNPQMALMHMRRLLRFSSLIHNVGTEVFRPHEPPERWVWHACHISVTYTVYFPTRLTPKCISVLPDLEPDVQALQDSAYSTVIPLFQAQCALEENCFPPSVYNLISRNPQMALMHMRRLLRFSSLIHNVGTEVFRPHEPPERWVWHACHM
ncbi:hypothetical protein AHF37_02360 [Paragonimus kellicotti]|nr:hypothetical protein AHF37_02360 [Paragonimus kellicotti]